MVSAALARLALFFFVTASLAQVARGARRVGRPVQRDSHSLADAEHAPLLRDPFELLTKEVNSGVGWVSRYETCGKFEVGSLFRDLAASGHLWVPPRSFSEQRVNAIDAAVGMRLDCGRGGGTRRTFRLGFHRRALKHATWVCEDFRSLPSGPGAETLQLEGRLRPRGLRSVPEIGMFFGASWNLPGILSAWALEPGDLRCGMVFEAGILSWSIYSQKSRSDPIASVDLASVGRLTQRTLSCPQAGMFAPLEKLDRWQVFSQRLQTTSIQDGDLSLRFRCRSHWNTGGAGSRFDLGITTPWREVSSPASEWFCHDLLLNPQGDLVGRYQRLNGPSSFTQCSLRSQSGLQLTLTISGNSTRTETFVLNSSESSLPSEPSLHSGELQHGLKRKRRFQPQTFEVFAVTDSNQYLTMPRSPRSAFCGSNDVGEQLGFLTATLAKYVSHRRLAARIPARFACRKDSSVWGGRRVLSFGIGASRWDASEDSKWFCINITLKLFREHGKNAPFVAVSEGDLVPERFRSMSEVTGQGLISTTEAISVLRASERQAMKCRFTMQEHNKHTNEAPALLWEVVPELGDGAPSLSLWMSSVSPGKVSTTALCRDSALDLLRIRGRWVERHRNSSGSHPAHRFLLDCPRKRETALEFGLHNPSARDAWHSDPICADLKVVRGLPEDTILAGFLRGSFRKFQETSEEHSLWSALSSFQGSAMMCVLKIDAQRAVPRMMFTVEVQGAVVPLFQMRLVIEPAALKDSELWQAEGLPATSASGRRAAPVSEPEQTSIDEVDEVDAVDLAITELFADTDGVNPQEAPRALAPHVWTGPLGPEGPLRA